MLNVNEFLWNNSPVVLPPQDIVVDPHQSFTPPVLWWSWMVFPIQEHYCCINNFPVAALVWDFSIKFICKQNNNILTMSSFAQTPLNVWNATMDGLKRQQPHSSSHLDRISLMADRLSWIWMWCWGWFVHNINGVDNEPIACSRGRMFGWCGVCLANSGGIECWATAEVRFCANISR